MKLPLKGCLNVELTIQFNTIQYKLRQRTDEIVDFRHSSRYNRSSVATNIELRTAVFKEDFKMAPDKHDLVMDVISARNYRNLRTYTDRTERYFKNKVVDLSYLDEICVVCCYGVRETFHGSPERKEFSSRCKRRVNFQHVFFYFETRYLRKEAAFHSGLPQDFSFSVWE